MIEYLKEFMNYFKEFMNYLGRYRLIYDRQDNEPYLERYYLFLKDREKFPFNIFLHKFLKSDPDDLHDHPWCFISLPLYPGYWEYLDGRKEPVWRGPFSIRYANEFTYHRVELHKDYNYCWSIFIPGIQKREWGFKTINGWVNNKQYLSYRKNV
jgi:hypothetical protein